MRLSSFEAGQRLCRDVKSAQRQVAVFVKLANDAIEKARFADAIVCLQNAHNWSVIAEERAGQ